jgi:hypothetical protein
MSNVLATSSIVAKKTLAILENSLSFASNVNRNYEDEYGANMSRGYAPGGTIKIKKPARYTYRAGRVSVPQASVDSTIDLTLSQGGTDLNFTTYERTVGISENSIDEKIQAAIASVVNEIDRQGLELAKNAAFNTLNVTGALPTTQLGATQVYTDSLRRLNEMAAPTNRGDKSFIMGPGLNGASVAGLAGLFNSQEKISKQYGNGMMVDSLGFVIGMDQNVSTLTLGAATATNISGAGQTGSSITVVAVAAGTLAKGTAITLPGVFAVNPQTRLSTGVLADFIVTADVAQGATTIPVSPALVTSGAFQNVTASPTTGQPYIIKGTASASYQTNIAFHKDAFTLAMVPMEMPAAGTGAKAHQESRNGFTVKVTDGYDFINDNTLMRIDVLFGWAATYPELAVRYLTV